MSQVTKKTIKAHGLCETCGKLIEKGVSMKRTTRHATREEIQDENVSTKTMFPGMGPMVGIKLHLECPHPESPRGRAIRRERGDL